MLVPRVYSVVCPIYKPVGHVVTGDLTIIRDATSDCPSYREQNVIDWTVN